MNCGISNVIITSGVKKGKGEWKRHDQVGVGKGTELSVLHTYYKQGLMPNGLRIQYCLINCMKEYYYSHIIGETEDQGS